MYFFNILFPHFLQRSRIIVSIKTHTPAYNRKTINAIKKMLADREKSPQNRGIMTAAVHNSNITFK